MFSLRTTSAKRILAGVCASALALTAPALAGVSIQVNGSPVNFTQTPVERGGRVYVPLRGVFENLGATVVYDNGTINATGRGHTVNLHIGSTVATVDGQQQTLDAAPFILGASTLVPLRFVSQALGATVDYDASTQMVSVNASGGNSSYVAPRPDRLTLLNVSPSTYTNARQPLVHAEFSQAVDPNSVRVTLDGRDVSQTTEIAPRYVSFTPPYPLTPEQHSVTVTGSTQDGATFSRTITFTSGAGAAANFLDHLTPASGSQVPSTFTISGVTVPGARVHIAAIAGAEIGGVFRVATGSYTTDVRANSEGRFEQTVSTGDLGGGGNIGIRITSTAPASGSAVTRTLTVHA